MTIDLKDGWFSDRAPKLRGFGAGYVEPPGVITGPGFIATDFGIEEGPQIIYSADGITWLPVAAFPAGFTQMRMSAKGTTGWVSFTEKFGQAPPVIARTTGGAVWLAATHDAFQCPTSWTLAYGAGTYVVGGTDASLTTGKFMYSVDEGLTWTQIARGDDRSNVTIAYGNSVFVAVSPSSVTVEGTALTIPAGQPAAASVQTSSDGITWSAVSFPASLQNVTTTSGAAGNWMRIRYLSDGRFWVCGFEPDHGAGTLNAIFSYSTDNGTTWTQVTTGLEFRGFDIAYDGTGHYVAATRDTSLLISSDGTSWSAVDTGFNTWWKSVVYADGKFVAVGQDLGSITGYTNETIAYSTDNGATWTLATNPLGAPGDVGPFITDFQDVEYG